MAASKGWYFFKQWLKNDLLHWVSLFLKLRFFGAKDKPISSFTTPAALPNQMLLIACVCCFCHLCMFVHVKSKIRAAKEARCHYLEGSKTIITSSWNLLFEFQIIVSIFCQAKVANGPLHVASFVHGKIIKSEKWQINWITYEYLLMSVDFSWHVSLNLICTKNANMDCLDYVGNRNTCVNVG